MKKKVLITGSLGQDGYFLSKKLLSQGHHVVGVVKKNKIFENQNYQILKVDLTNQYEVDKLVSEVNPTHIFNLAGVSDIFFPFDNMSEIYEQNCKIPLNLIQSILNYDKKIKFFQASSSLMYANGDTKIINENCILSPKYPYGISKASIFTQMKELRKEKNLYLSTGIFFNHDSEKRTNEFFTQKVVLGLKDILENKTDKLILGNLNVYKDISYAEDFIDGVVSQMDLEESQDIVFGSGHPIILRDFVSKCFAFFGLDYKKYVISNDEKITQFGLVADTTNAQKILNWKTTKNIDDIIKIMIEDKIQMK